MLSKNLLSYVSNFLVWRDLLHLSGVDQRCREISQNEGLWQRECMREFLDSLTLFGFEFTGKTANCLTKDSNKKWKHRFVKMMKVQKKWTELRAGNVWSTQDILWLRSRFFDVLRSPNLPDVALRRENDYFPTVFQDIIANEVGNASTEQIGYKTEDPEAQILQLIDEHSFDLLNEFNDKFDKNCLTLAKFMCTVKQQTKDGMEVEPDELYHSWSTAGSYRAPELQLALAVRDKNPSKAFVLKIFHILENSLNQFCKMTFMVLSQQSDAYQLLVEYTRRWQAYSASMSRLNTAYRPFTDLFNDIYDHINPDMSEAPNMSLARLMLNTWRRNVYTPMQTQLQAATAHAIESFREDMTLPGEKPYDEYEDELAVIIRISESFVDLSASEVNVRYLSHSQLPIDGAYATFHDSLLRSSERFYAQLASQPDQSKAFAVFKQDENFLLRATLPMTQAAIERMKNDMMALAWSKNFAGAYMRFDGSRIPTYLDDKTVSYLARQSHFGKYLFSLAPHRDSFERIENFIKHICSFDQTMLNQISMYNSIEEKRTNFQGCIGDEEIEARMGVCGLEVGQVVAMPLYTMTEDLTPDLVESVMQMS